MDLQLQDKVILVSGGAKGIGGAISRGLIEEGAIPVIIDPSEMEGQELLEFAKGKALHLKKRLFSAADAQEVVQATLSTYGRIDGLVNNAGTNDGVGLEKGSPEAFLQSVEKNVGHYYFLAHYALEALKKSKGVILNISSKTAVTGQGNTSGYVAAKGAQCFPHRWCEHSCFDAKRKGHLSKSLWIDDVEMAFYNLRSFEPTNAVLKRGCWHAQGLGDFLQVEILIISQC